MQRMTRASIHGSQLLLCLLALLAMLLSGCGSSGAGGPQLDPDQVFTWPIIGTTQFSDLVLDPANVTDYPSATVIDAIYGGLVTSDHNLNVVPDMATWDVSPDGRQYTFHLNSNLHFSDGASITAQDFAYSLDRALDPNVCGKPGCNPVAGTYLSDIKGAADRLSGNSTTIIGTGVIAPDALTLIINLDKPVAYFLEALTYPTSFPVEKSLVNKYGNDWTQHLNEGGCSGPFLIKSYGDGKALTLTPNPYWYGKTKLTLKEIVRPYVKDPDTAYAAYRQGQYDYTDVPTDEYQAARDQEDFHQVGLLQTNYVGMNLDYGPLKDLRVRQALALALNKQLIADRVLNGAQLPTNHIVPEGMPGFDDALTAPGSDTRTLTGDITQAQKLLNSYYADCKCGSSLALTLTYPDTPDRARTAEAMKNIWETVLPGVQITINALPTLHDLVVNLLTKTAGNHEGALQMWLIGWIADYPDPQDWLSLQFAPNSPLNFSNYQDGEQDGHDFTAWNILQKADVEQDPSQRMNLYNEAEQQLVDDVAWLPYAQPLGIWRLRTYIQGYNPSALNLMSDQDWANVFVLAH